MLLTIYVNKEHDSNVQLVPEAAATAATVEATRNRTDEAENILTLVDVVIPFDSQLLLILLLGTSLFVYNIQRSECKRIRSIVKVYCGAHTRVLFVYLFFVEMQGYAHANAYTRTDYMCATHTHGHTDERCIKIPNKKRYISETADHVECTNRCNIYYMLCFQI